jgi:hypothetical protein
MNLQVEKGHMPPGRRMHFDGKAACRARFEAHDGDGARLGSGLDVIAMKVDDGYAIRMPSQLHRVALSYAEGSWARGQSAISNHKIE